MLNARASHSLVGDCPRLLERFEDIVAASAKAKKEKEEAGNGPSSPKRLGRRPSLVHCVSVDEERKRLLRVWEEERTKALAVTASG